MSRKFLRDYMRDRRDCLPVWFRCFVPARPNTHLDLNLYLSGYVLENEDVSEVPKSRPEKTSKTGNPEKKDSDQESDREIKSVDVVSER